MYWRLYIVVISFAAVLHVTNYVAQCRLHITGPGPGMPEGLFITLKYKHHLAVRVK